MMARFGPEVLGALIALLLQAVVAPYLAIGYALPNIALAFALAYGVASRRTDLCVMPFLVGLGFDLLGSGPVGAMALLTLCATLAATFLVARFDNDTAFVPIASICVLVLLVEVLYALVCVTCGWDVGLGEALAYRALPGWAYDTVVALVIYPLCRFVLRQKPDEMDVSQIS